MKNNTLYQYIRLQEKIRKEKKLFEKYNHIEIGKTPSEILSVKLFPIISSEKRSLIKPDLLLVDLINRLDYINEQIIEVYSMWEIITMGTNEVNFDKQKALLKHRLIIEMIVHELKVVIDRIIALSWCIKKNTAFDSIEVASIGKYMNEDEFNDYDDCRSFLEKINNIDNACKHSFVCHEGNFIGRTEPGIWVYYDKGNKMKPIQIGDTLNNIIDGFNKFYKKAFNVIELL